MAASADLRTARRMWLLAVLSGLLLSVPYLVPHAGCVALFALVPLLMMEQIAGSIGKRHVWWWHYGAFVIWNACTTFWVCNATVGGGIFAILANAFQMSVIFGLFRLSRRRLKGFLPYIFLAALWIAWEKWYLTWADISWPWLVLGNAFAGTVGVVQWYELTGTLGGSLWVWAANLAVFGIMRSLSTGGWGRLTRAARIAAAVALPLIFLLPPAGSFLTAWRYASRASEAEKARPEGGLSQMDVVILQPNFDPYEKFESMSRREQDEVLCAQMDAALSGDVRDVPCLVLAPETFTSGMTVGSERDHVTFRRIADAVSIHPGATVLFGASTYSVMQQGKRPSPTARLLREGVWYESHNSALTCSWTGRSEIFHKNKLVVGVEMMPYPRLFRPIDDALGGVMGRCTGLGRTKVLHAETVRPGGESVPFGCAICYESIYGEYCTGYVRDGARMLTVITNDAWWGDTPGYRQHLSYSRLRAIETRRQIARCANTGISAIIDEYGNVTARSSWWERQTLEGRVRLLDGETFYVAHGDIVGRVAIFLTALLLLALILPRRW